MDAAGIHRLCLLELVEPDAAVEAAAAALVALLASAGTPEEAEDARIHALRITRTAIATQRRWQLSRRLLHPDTAWRAVPGEDILEGLRGRERSVLALELGAGAPAAEIAEVLDVGEPAVLAARRRGLERVRGDPAVLRGRAAAITVPEGLDDRLRAATASRRRRDRLDPRRLLAGGAMRPLATAALVALLAGAVGAGAGVLGRHSADRPVAQLAAGAAGPRPGPPPRAFAAAGYDPQRAEVVLFGGRAGENRLLDDTWTWDGSSWRLRYQTVGPSPRKAAAMAWDPSSGRLLLFGGQGLASDGRGEIELRDTWAWDGTGWVPLRPAVSPPGRLGAGTAALATDATTGEVLLVTDGASEGSTCSLSVWHWSAGTWVRLRPPASPRAALTGRLAYAPGTGGLVLVTALPTASACGGDAAVAAVWTWDGATWTEQRQVTPLAAKHIVDGPLSSSPAGVVVPGYHTYSWDGSDWHDSGPDGPGARFGAAIAYDARHRQSVLFGGCCIVGGGPESVYDDTWTWDGESWLRRGGARTPAESASAQNPQSPWVESALPLGSVDAIAADRDAVYAVVERLQLGMWDLDRAMVARVDRATGQVTTAGPFPAADSLALAGGRLWVGAGVHPGIVNPGHQALYGLDPATLQVEQELSLLPAPDVSGFSARLAGTGELLWLGWGGDLIRIDPRSGAVLSRLDPEGGRVDDVALSSGGDRLYVSTRLPSEDAFVSVRDPHTGATHATATEHSTAGSRLAVDADGVWITLRTGLSSALSHRRATDLAPLGPTAPALGGDGRAAGNTLRAFVAGGVLWLADSQRSTLSCADPRSGAVRGGAEIGRAQELTGDAGGIYLGTTDGVLVIGVDPRCAG
ncbi:MAG TPA: hypothetical protein VMU20_09825 [Candidatus Dormibacteraeota bacterium]|nr:hypothetical protein [Candidatus Dormibacteraeota bacterium]